MASYIAIPRDLTKVKTKVMFNLTKRQLVCFGLGALVGLPVFFILKILGTEISSCVMAMMTVMIPFFLFAMYEKNGQPLEVMLKQIIELKFIRPKKRPYQTLNYYRCLENQAQVAKEVNAIVQHSKGVKENGSKASTGLKQSRAEADKGNNRKSKH